MAKEASRGSPVRYILLGSLLFFSCRTWSINVALHAQVPPSKKQIVGSAVTMAGLRQAFLSRNSDNAKSSSGEDGNYSIAGEQQRDVGNTTTFHPEIFYPFNYAGLHDRKWDLVIIEGWFAMINTFIHEVRAISYPLPVTILFYCLDPQYPGLPHVAALDIDGFLTNSESTQRYLLPSAPTALVPLAADVEAFPFYPDPPIPREVAKAGEPMPSKGETAENHVTIGSDRVSDSSGRVVYVGSADLIEYKEMLAWILHEAAPYGLDIYGSGWKQFPEFSEYWRGVLPQEDLASVYGRALAVIGVTMDAQRESGKINNRVFEALAVGAPLVSDHFPALEATFGDAILYIRQPGDVAKHIEALLLSSHAVGGIEAEAKARRRRRAKIEDHHTWAQRVEDILSFVGSLPGNTQTAVTHEAAVEGEASCTGGAEAARCSRQPGCLTLAIVVDGDLDGDITFESTFIPAVELLGSTYLVTWWVAPVPGTNSRDAGGDAVEEQTIPSQEYENVNKEKGASFAQRRHIQLPGDFNCLSSYDVVWAAGRWDGSADRSVRDLLQRGDKTTLRATQPRLTEQLTGLVLWGSLCTPSRNRIVRDQAWSGPKGTVGDQSERCPAYAGETGLRWYDVVFTQTSGDVSFLVEQAWNGDVSNNLQQAWGYGSARTSRSDVLEKMVRTTPTLDVLVVGADNQVPDMLQLLQAPGLARVAVAIIVPPSLTDTTTATRSELLSILSAAGLGNADRIDDLPQRMSFFVVEPSKGSSFAPLPTEVLLIRRGTDADALAELASGAAKVAVVATGQLGIWATVVTASATSDRWEWAGRRQGGAPRLVDAGGDNRVRALIEEHSEEWSTLWYSRRLIAGMTRALCLGRGNSRISIVRPASNGPGSVVGAVGTVITVEVQVEDFYVGRDGQWCITVQGQTALCVLLNKFVVELQITSSANESEWEEMLTKAKAWEGKQDENGCESNISTAIGTGHATSERRGVLLVEVVAELRSSMYRDVLRRSKPIHLSIDPGWGPSAFGEHAECVGLEGSVGSCSEIGAELVDSSSGKSLRGSDLKTSIDAKDFFDTGTVFLLDSACVSKGYSTCLRR